MGIDRNTLLFFDASCLIAASGSPSGGSSYLFWLCSAGFLRGALSTIVLVEALRNIREKLAGPAEAAFQRFIEIPHLIIGGIPQLPDVEKYIDIVGEKDAHVLAASFEIDADFLITLDKKLIFQVTNSALSIKAYSPGEFIKMVLPEHDEFPRSWQG